MPEFKHQFSGGKMNQDVDERLVPDGEYRDAMNVQVSTSDGSDVGVIQNIQGNKQGCTDVDGVSMPPLYINPCASSVVGSISDEKNDSFYWFISGLSTRNSDASSVYSLLTHINNLECEIFSSVNYYGHYTFKDIIVEAKNSYNTTVSNPNNRSITTCRPTFVDVWGFMIKNDYTTNSLSSFNINSVELGKLVEPGWTVAAYDSSPAIVSSLPLC